LRNEIDLVIVSNQIFVAICAAALPGSPAVQVDNEVQGEQGIAHFRLKDTIFAWHKWFDFPTAISMPDGDVIKEALVEEME
jgi:hypothetical protein